MDLSWTVVMRSVELGERTVGSTRKKHVRLHLLDGAVCTGGMGGYVS